MLAASVIGAFAQTPDYIVSEFDAPGDLAAWARWWGSASQLYEHDAAVDADNDAASGSLRATIGFDFATYGGDNQFALIGGFPQLDGSLYTNLVFDIRWDPASPRRTSGDHGWLEYGFRAGGFRQSWLGAFAVPTHGNWIRVVAPIPPTLADLGTVSGVVFKMWAGNAGSALTGTATFWVDNIKLIAITNDIPIPPPTLSISRPERGLNLTASHPTEQFQRQNIRTISTATSWLGQFDPVTYAITIAKFPDSAHSGFQAHMFLAPPSQLPFGPGDNSPDWNAPNVIFWQIANNADGTAYTRFMYKTNQPSGNDQFWGVGTLAVTGSATPTGRWSLTFNSSTEASITTPDGSVTNFSIAPEVVALFENQLDGNPLYAWFGAQPNNSGNIGQEAIISRIEIDREFDSIDEQFTDPALNATRWAVVAAHPAGVVAVPPDATAWVKWTLPDVNFTLQNTATLDDANSWQDTPLAPVQIIDHKRVLITPATFPGDKAFFRMRKP